MDFSTYISKMEKEIVQATLDLVKIKSVKEPPLQKKPFGNGISSALDCILRMAAEMGFKTYNLDGYIGYAEYGEGENYIAAIGHIDTVEEGRGWLFRHMAPR